MYILVNGKETEIQAGDTATSLISRLQLNPHTIVIERNGTILKKQQWDETTLNQGDRLEIVTFVGGGD